MSEAINIEIGGRIRKIRGDKGLSREALAESSGISTNFLGMVENGVKGMTVKTLRGIARALNVTSDYLIFGREDTTASLDYAAQALANLSDAEREDVLRLLDVTTELVRRKSGGG